MTKFVDFVIASGNPRLRVVRDAKSQHESRYDPAADFWKILRLEIVRIHREGADPKSLRNVIGKTIAPLKQEKYPPLIEAYVRWLGKREVTWDKEWSTRWSSENLVVRVNPELGLIIDEVPHVIKLYFKAEKPSKSRLDTMVYLLRKSFPKATPSVIFGVLDVPRRHFYQETVSIAGLEALLIGEAAAFSSMWEAL